MSTSTTTPRVPVRFADDPNPLDVHQVAYKLIDELAAAAGATSSEGRSALRCDLYRFSLHFELPGNADDSVSDAIEAVAPEGAPIREILIRAANIVASKMR